MNGRLDSIDELQVLHQNFNAVRRLPPFQPHSPPPPTPPPSSLPEVPPSFPHSHLFLSLNNHVFERTPARLTGCLV